MGAELFDLAIEDEFKQISLAARYRQLFQEQDDEDHSSSPLCVLSECTCR